MILIDMQHQEAISYYMDGNPVKEVSKKFDVSISTLFRAIKREKIDTSKRNKMFRKSPKHDLSGKRYNHLKVVKMEITPKSKDRTWRSICICDCGREADVNTNYLMRGLVKTCGSTECQYHRQDYSNNGKNNVNFTGHEEIHGQKWKAYECGAKRRNLEFSITIEYAWNLFISQDRKCALTGDDIYFGRTATSGTTASLDRKNSKLGYIEGNVQWVHKDINLLKMALPESKLFSLCKKIVTHNNL